MLNMLDDDYEEQKQMLLKELGESLNISDEDVTFIDACMRYKKTKEVDEAHKKNVIAYFLTL